MKKRRYTIDKKRIWRGAKIRESCIAHRMMGATVRGYSFIEMHGAMYALCYRCTQSLCRVAHPVRDETYETPAALNVCGGLPRGGKEMPRHVVICYETPVKEEVVSDTTTNV